MKDILLILFVFIVLLVAGILIHINFSSDPANPFPEPVNDVANVLHVIE